MLKERAVPHVGLAALLSAHIAARQPASVFLFCADATLLLHTLDQFVHSPLPILAGISALRTAF